jgi:3-phenylpropionate/trans-cinnamate dioxygenase ferredoxin subunit
MVDITVPEFVFAAKVDEVREGEILAMNIDDTPLALTRVQDRIVAFGDVCTHDDGPLAEGNVDGDCVVCPRHGARFNLFTGRPTFPAPYPIPIYETRIDGDEILVKLAG